MHLECFEGKSISNKFSFFYLCIQTGPVLEKNLILSPSALRSMNRFAIFAVFLAFLSSTSAAKAGIFVERGRTVELPLGAGLDVYERFVSAGKQFYINCNIRRTSACGRWINEDGSDSRATTTTVSSEGLVLQSFTESDVGQYKMGNNGDVLSAQFSQ
ncbi:unnamed protein product [Caenorhabditis auriculariae]|uniref:Uncharacterized protein n=1 Tax=Caenorhabditis auriculariae TaxID=2777116 RepID=A0A8S1GTP4_9PELO|nr:unnamed protein product [Caenorhabditis auriculariae]